MSCRTKYPVVFIHGKWAVSRRASADVHAGVFGYGKTHPLWNLWVPYWPERVLEQLNPNHVITEVGVLSSDHDRACEVFFQVYGGTVDYGEEHASRFGHERFGRVYAVGAFPQWSEENPVHLVGHSFGSTTAIELYQLLCRDAFRVGSNAKWVRSITSIAGPLSGTTLTHALGVCENAVVRYGIAHILSIAIILWFKLAHDYPFLSRIWDIRMDQWKSQLESYSCAFSHANPVLRSLDLAVFSAVPAIRVRLNGALEHMDKLHLLSIATSPGNMSVPFTEMTMVIALLFLLLSFRAIKSSSWLHRVLSWVGRYPRGRTCTAGLLVLLLSVRLSGFNYAKSPTMYWLAWMIRRASRKLHQLSSKGTSYAIASLSLTRALGLDFDTWNHNDGAVNIHSMIYPRLAKAAAALDERLLSPRTTESTQESSSESIDACTDDTEMVDETERGLGASALMSRCASHLSLDSLTCNSESSPARENTSLAQIISERSRARLQKGHWYVYRVESNHLTGMFWDGEAVSLYQNLFRLISRQYECEASD